MPAPSRSLLLRFDPGQPGLDARLTALDARQLGRSGEILLPLGDRHAEEVLAECCRLGLTVTGSVVESAIEGG